MTQPGQGEEAGQLDLAVVADLRGFAARLRREVNAAAAKVQAKVPVAVKATGLRTELRKAIKEASDKAQATARIGVRVGVADFRRAIREVAEKAKAQAKIGVQIAATEMRRAVKEAGDKAKAKVKVDADTKPAAEKVAKLKDARINLRADSKKFIRDAGKAAATAAGIAGTIFTFRFGKAFSLVGGLSKAIAGAIGSGLQSATDVAAMFFKNFSNTAATTAANVATAIGTAVTSGTAMTIATGGLNLLVGALVALAAAAAIGAAGLLALAPIVLLVGGVFGTLFTILAGGISSVGVFMLGMRGLTDAFGEVMDKGKATNETLKKLSPNARKLVHELEKLKKPLGTLRKFVQDKLLAGMNLQLRTLVTKWLPAMKPMLGDLATRFNNFTKKIVAALVKPEYIANIKAATAGFGDFIDRLGQSMGPLIGTFGRLAKASVPFLRELGDMIGGLIDKFSAWVAAAEKSGDLDKFMKDAAQALRDIWDIGGLVVGILGEIVDILFPGSKRASGNFLTNVKESLQKLKDWLADPENKKKIQDWIDKIQDFIDKVRNEWIPKIEDWLGKIDHWINKIDGWVTRITDFKDRITGAWDEVKQATEDRWNAIVLFFQGLPDRIIGWLSTLPARVGGIFAQIAQQAAYQAGFMIGQVVGFFLTLPGRVGAAIAALPGQVVGVFNRARGAAAGAVSGLVASAASIAASLPGRAAAAIASLPGRVSGVFHAARAAAVAAISQLVASATSIVASLPGRAASALGGLGGVLTGAGRALIRGLIDGIRDAVPGLEATLRWVSSKIPDWKGPYDHDKTMLVGAGKAIIGGLMRGINSQIPALRQQLQGLTGSIGQGVMSGYTIGAADTRPAVKAAEQLAAAQRDNTATPAADAEQAAGGLAPLVGSLTLNTTPGGSFRDQLEELMFQLRRIRRGGIVAGA